MNVHSPATTQALPVDAAAVGQALRCLLPDDWPAPGALRLERAWPAAAHGLAAQWSFELGASGRWTVYVRGGEPDSPGHCPRRTANGLRGLCGASGGLLMHSPDRDPQLPRLAECLEARPAPQAGPLAEVDVHPTLLAYKPGRRATLLYREAESGRPAIVGKLFRDGRGGRLARRHHEVGAAMKHDTDGRVEVLQPCGEVAQLGLMLFRYAPGQHIEGPHGARLRLAMNLLATLHDLCIDGLEPFGAQLECGVVQRWQQLLGAIDGRLAEPMSRGLEALRTLTGSVDGAARAVTVHRDFYEAQYVVSGSTITLLDLDTLARGDAALDVGNWIAHEQLRRLEAAGQPLELQGLCAAAREAYVAAGGVLDPRHLEFYVASSLLRVGAVHALRARTGCWAGALWAQAERVLDRLL